VGASSQEFWNRPQQYHSGNLVSVGLWLNGLPVSGSFVAADTAALAEIGLVPKSGSVTINAVVSIDAAAEI
jgi:hypothetical protein